MKWKQEAFLVYFLLLLLQYFIIIIFIPAIVALSLMTSLKSDGSRMNVMRNIVSEILYYIREEHPTYGRISL